VMLDSCIHINERHVPGEWCLHSRAPQEAVCRRKPGLNVRISLSVLIANIQIVSQINQSACLEEQCTATFLLQH
jgi:hypothetical protein